MREAVGSQKIGIFLGIIPKPVDPPQPPQKKSGFKGQKQWPPKFYLGNIPKKYQFF